MSGLITTTSTLSKIKPGLEMTGRLYADKMPKFWQYYVGKTVATQNNYFEFAMQSDLGAAQSTYEAGGVPYVQQSVPFSKKIHLTQYSLGSILSFQVDMKALYNQLDDLNRQIARAFYIAKEIKGADIFNFCVTSGYTGIDGVVLASASHPIKGGGTFSNLSSATALSASALEVDVQNVKKHRTYGDTPYFVMGGFNLIVPTELDMLAQRILTSTNQAGTNNNDVNRVRYAVSYTPANPFLTSSTRYHLVPSSPEENPLRMLTGLPYTFKEDLDSDAPGTRYFAVEEFSYFWTKPHGIQTNAGA
jgi:hypothetical protein